jgi:hypothetical protein
MNIPGSELGAASRHYPETAENGKEELRDDDPAENEMAEEEKNARLKK